MNVPLSVRNDQNRYVTMLVAFQTFKTFVLFRKFKKFTYHLMSYITAESSSYRSQRHLSEITRNLVSALWKLNKQYSSSGWFQSSELQTPQKGETLIQSRPIILLHVNCIRCVRRRSQMGEYPPPPPHPTGSLTWCTINSLLSNGGILK